MKPDTDKAGWANERVAVVVPASPWPSNGGGQLRAARFAEAISQIAKVRCISLYATHPIQAPKEIDEIVVRPGVNPRIWALRTEARPLAPELPPYLVRRIQRLLDEFSPTIVIFDQTVTTGLIEALELEDAKVVFNSHNFDTNLHAQLDLPSSRRSQRNSIQNALGQELGAARASDLLICCSELDAAHFKEKASIDATVIANPLPDARVFTIPISKDRYTRSRLVFVGAMSYPPNRHAAISLVDTFTPTLEPGAKIVLVGNAAKTLPATVVDNPMVDVVADAPEILPYLERSSFSVMPIREGSGTRLKVLEAMAAGVIVIATAKAVEGLGVVADVHYANGETDQDLLQAYHRLSSDPETCLEMAQAARQFVKKNFSPDFFTSQVQDAIRKLRIGQSEPTPQKPASSGQRMVGTFHKSGTVLIARIFREFGKVHKRPVWFDRPGMRLDDWVIAVSPHSDFERTGIATSGCPVTMIVRDPRDIVISSAFYHMKSSEAWLHIPRDDFNGKTYQEAICALPDMKARFSFEMKNSARNTIRKMLSKRADPNLAHATWIKLEDLMVDEDMEHYRRLFESLEFVEDDIQKLVKIARKNSAYHGHKNVHMRDPSPQQWVRHFDEDLLQEFDEYFGDAAMKLGYD